MKSVNLHAAKEPERVRPIWESGQGHLAMVTTRTVCGLQVTIRCITDGEPTCPDCRAALDVLADDAHWAGLESFAGVDAPAGQWPWEG